MTLTAPVTPLDVYSVEYTVSANFTWGVLLKNGTSTQTSVEHHVCAATPPSAPSGLKADNNVLSATVADFGLSCASPVSAEGSSASPEQTVSFWAAATGAADVTAARLLGTVPASAGTEAQLTVPATVAAGSWAFFAVACADGLCSAPARVDGTVAAPTPCTPTALAVAAGPPPQVSWTCDADAGAGTVAAETFTVHVAATLDGPFAALPEVRNNVRTVALPDAYAFGAFYYYVEAASGGRTRSSRVHAYALRTPTRPGAVAAVWPPAGAVLPADEKDLTLCYRASSWGTTAAETDPASLRYTVQGTSGSSAVVSGTSQCATVELTAGAENYELKLHAENGAAVGADTTVSFETCQEAEALELTDVTLRASETGDQVTVEWALAGAPVFCTDLPGAHGFRVEVGNATSGYALVAWVGDVAQRAAALPFPSRGWHTARVTAYAGERTTAVRASAPVELRSGAQDRVCEPQALAVKGLRASRDAAATTLPRPVRLAWEAAAFPAACAVRGYEVRLDGRPLALLKEDAGAFVVPSAALPRTARTVTLTVVATTETARAEASVSVSVTDVAAVPFVALRSPRNSAWVEGGSSGSAGETTYEWEALPAPSGATKAPYYNYELWIGSDPDSLQLVGTYTDVARATVATSAASGGVTHWAVRACEAATGFCGALGTPFVHYRCVGAALAETTLRVSPNAPPVAEWAATTFGRDCADAADPAAPRGWYTVSVAPVDTATGTAGTPVLTETLLPSATSLVLAGLAERQRYRVTLDKCARTGTCHTATAEFEVAETKAPEIGTLAVTGTGRSRPAEPSTAEGTVLLTNGTRLAWSVTSWGRECTAGCGCESRVWLRANGAATWTLLGRVPFSSDENNGGQQDYALALTDAMYLQTQGTVEWAVVVDNGSLDAVRKSTDDGGAALGMCRPHRPAQVALLAPASTSHNSPKTNVFAVAPLAVWGDCSVNSSSAKGEVNASSNWYTFHATAAQDPSHYRANASRAADMRADAETGAVGMANTLEYMTWRWTVYATNTFGLRGAAPATFYYVSCEVEPPARPEWTGNFSSSTFDGSFFEDTSASASASTSGNNNDDDQMGSKTESQLLEPLLVSPHMVNLTWTPFDKSSFGQFCQSGSSMAVNSLVLYMSDDGMASWRVVEEVTFDSYRVVKPAGGTGGTAAAAWPLGVPLYFYINASNNAAFTLSRVLKVVTLARSCADAACTQDQGECDLATAECACFAGYSGARCERNLGRERNVKIAVGVAVGGALLLAVIAVVVVLLVRKFYRQHKALMMKPPDFEALRAPPVRMPAFAPDVDAPADLSVLEAALLSETGFQMVWGLLGHTSATEIDTMAKALVYFYQHHNKGLELQMFLIMCEISSSQTSTVLFRANSAATRAFKFFSKMYALPYLYRTLAVLLQGLIRDVDDAEEEEQQQGNGSGNGGNGGDGSSSGTGAGAPGATLSQFGDGTGDDDNACSDESINFLKLQLMCQKFFIQIMRSDKACPGELKHICAFLRSQLEQRFPDFVFKGIGAFMFLRFYNTAITVPETYGLLPSAPRPSVRKQLLLVSKVLQNLANGVLFGEKEPNMIRLNSFITQQRPAYELFLGRLCDNQAPLSDPVPISDDSYHASLAIILNQFFIITRNNPELLDQLDCVPPELAELVRNARKDKKKKKDPVDPAAADALLDAPPQDSNPTTTTTPSAQ